MSKLAWFLALFAAGLALLFTPPQQGAAIRASAHEREIQPSELPCPFELGLDGPCAAGRTSEKDTAEKDRE